MSTAFSEISSGGPTRQSTTSKQKHSCWKQSVTVLRDSVTSSSPRRRVKLRRPWIPPWIRRLVRIGKIVQTFDPSDVIAWQEVRYDSEFHPMIGNASLLYRRKHQVFHLLYILRKSVPNIPFHFTFRPAMTYTQKDKDAVQVEGVSLFTRHHILRQDSRLLTKTEGEGDDHQRVCLGIAFLFPPWGIVHVFNTHMSLSLKQQDFNMREIETFITEFASNEASHDLPVAEILVGDMNAEPKDARWLPRLLKAGFVDAWESYATANRIGHPGYTFNNLYTRLSKRIDFVLVRQRDGKAQVRNVSLYGRTQQHDEFAPSDHLAVAVDVILN